MRSPLELSVPLQTIRSGATSAVPIRWGGQRTTKKRSTSAAPGSETIIASFSSEHVEARACPFAKRIGNRERICLPERCSRKKGARPSRSLCSASRRTEGAADSTHRLVRQANAASSSAGRRRERSRRPRSPSSTASFGKNDTAPQTPSPCAAGRTAIREKLLQCVNFCTTLLPEHRKSCFGRTCCLRF